MKRVVVTGLGIISSIGLDAKEVTESLKKGKSGITFSEEYEFHGFRSQVHGMPKINLSDHIDKRQLRFMGDGAAYNYIAMEQAIKDSGLTETEISNERTGLIVGSGGPSTKNLFAAHQIVLEKKSPKRMGPFMVTRGMSSTNSACLATPFKIKGVNYSISSACSTSAHCIGNGLEQIQLGKQDIIFAGGGEELDWTLSCLFDAMGAMSSKYNDTPENASRAFDRDRDGFVIAGGGGVVVVEELNHAIARGAKIYAEFLGGGLSSDAHHITAPHPEGNGVKAVIKNCLKDSKINITDVDLINTHGTSTPLGDIAELKAIDTVFGNHAEKININSTKSMTGHLLGAAGAIEAISTILSLKEGIVPPTINHTNVDENINPKLNLTLNKAQERSSLIGMSNTFGFGGHNACVLFKKFS